MNTQQQIDRVINEGGDGYSLAGDQADRAAIAALSAEARAFAAEWTPEVLAARKSVWNAEMLALSAKRVTMTPRLMTSIINRLGYGLSDINRAKALHA